MKIIGQVEDASITADCIGNFPGLKRRVYLAEGARANLLPFAKVRDECLVTFDNIANVFKVSTPMGLRGVQGGQKPLRLQRQHGR
jgi:hypothetical protein